MKYDFDVVIDRSAGGSKKWDDMRKVCPDLPAGIVPLSVADMEFKNAPEIMEGLREWCDGDQVTLGYTGPTESYNEAVKAWMKQRHNWDVDMKWNILSPGVVTAFFCALRAFSEPGDGVIIFSPVYYPFKMGVEINKRTLLDVPLISRDRRYEIDWDKFEAAAQRPDTKILLFCSPHNPVGRVWTREELQRISEICLKHSVLMISDEIHNDLIMPGYKHTVYATLSEEAAQNCIICTSPSKTFSLAGLQTSNIFVPNAELKERLFKEMFASAIFTLNAVGYRACEIAYTQCGDWLAQAIDTIHGNALFVERYLEEYIPQIKAYPLESTYLQWWDCRGLFSDYKEQEAFLQQKAYLFLDEGYLFGDAGQGFTRINLACPRNVLESALERLRVALMAR